MRALLLPFADMWGLATSREARSIITLRSNKIWQLCSLQIYTDNNTTVFTPKIKLSTYSYKIYVMNTTTKDDI